MYGKIKAMFQKAMSFVGFQSLHLFAFPFAQWNLVHIATLRHGPGRVSLRDRDFRWDISYRPDMFAVIYIYNILIILDDIALMFEIHLLENEWVGPSPQKSTIRDNYTHIYIYCTSTEGIIFPSVEIPLSSQNVSIFTELALGFHTTCWGSKSFNCFLTWRRDMAWPNHQHVKIQKGCGNFCRKWEVHHDLTNESIGMSWDWDWNGTRLPRFKHLQTMSLNIGVWIKRVFATYPMRYPPMRYPPSTSINNWCLSHPPAAWDQHPMPRIAGVGCSDFSKVFHGKQHI